MNNTQFNHIPEQRPSHFRRPDTIDRPLYVISPLFNPSRYRSRWKLYEEFCKYVIDSGAHMVTVECSYGQRERVMQPVSEKHTVIHITSESEIWIKENLINLGIQRLPEDAEYIAWIDGDIRFMRTDWVGETIQQLQHYKVVQMFAMSIDLDPNYIPFQTATGFIHDWIHGVPDYNCYNGNYRKPNHFHTGYAWATTKDTIRQLGGLIDWAVLGSADNHMARCLIGEWEKSVNGGVSQEYKDTLKIWQERAIKYINYNLGYVHGAIYHFFHGAKKNRFYKERWKILVEHQFKPSTDLKKDWNGLYQLTDNKPKLKQDIQFYFKARNEDSTDTGGIKNFIDYDK